MKKKVLISKKDIVDITSGAQNKALQEASIFYDLGFDSYVIAEKINPSLIEQNNGLPVKTLRWPISGYRRRKFYAKRVQAWVKKNRPDLIIGHGEILDQDVCFIHNCVHLAHQRIYNKPVPKNHQVARIHDQILTEQKFKLLICNSELLKNELCRRYEIPQEKAFVIHPEYNDLKFDYTKKETWRNEIRDKLGFKSEDLIVGLITSGNFKKRNVQLFIHAATKFPNLKFVIAGKNKDIQYEKLSEELGLKDKITFLPSVTEVEKYYSMIDIFVLPALIEEFGRSVLEAMAMELPVIVSSYVGASEILEGRSREMILEDLTADELIQKIQKALESMNELGELNRKTALKYTHEKQNQKLVQLLKNKDLI